MTSTRSLGVVLALLMGLSTPLSAQPTGISPPEDIFVEARFSAGGISLSAESITLTRGHYYRLNLQCMPSDHGEKELTFATDPLVRNSHLRVLTVDAIEVYVQGLSFRALQCEGAGAVKFSFYPLRAGTYEIEVSSDDAANSFLVIVE